MRKPRKTHYQESDDRRARASLFPHGRTAHERRLTILYRAAKPGGVLIHAEGGIALKNRDLQKLMRDGHVIVVRDVGIPKHTRRFRRDADSRRLGMHSTAYIRRTRAIATAQGMALAGHGWMFES